MTKFADELFTDLMREHGPALQRLDQQVARPAAPSRSAHARAAYPPTGDPRPPRRRSQWLAPVAAAAGVTLAVSLAVVLGSRVHPGGQPSASADRPAPVYVYSANSGTLTPISATGALGRPVKVGPRARRFPGRFTSRFPMPSIQENVVLPDGTTDYVIYLTKSKAQVLRTVDLATGAAGTPIPLGPRAEKMVLTPDGKTAYVLYQGRQGAGDAVRPVSLATGTLGRPIPLGGPAYQVAMAPDGKTVYAVLAHPAVVTPISTATNTAGSPIPVPGASRMVFTSDGRTAWVLGKSGLEQTATPISTVTNRPGTPIRTGPWYHEVVFTPDGKIAYDISLERSVTPVATATGRAGTPIKVRTAEMAITPDSKTAYVVDDNYLDVTPISVATNTVGAPFRVSGDPNPGQLVISPDGKTAYYSYTAGDKQVVTLISTATSTPVKRITIRGAGIDLLIPGEQDGRVGP